MAHGPDLGSSRRGGVVPGSRPDARSGERGFSLIEILAVTGVAAIVAAMAVPMASSAFVGYQLRADQKALAGVVALAKLRASASFTRARVHADLDAHTYRLEVWDRDGASWAVEGATVGLGGNVTFGFGDLEDPPPNTQDEIEQAAACTDEDGDAIDDTACIVFNSRGIPIDGAGAPLGGNALYLTDGVGVRVTTVTATPLIREWWSPAHDAQWIRQ